MVELIYKEPRSLSVRNVKLDQVVLENFEISREILVEMRRYFACHSTIIFGMLQFRVHELVKCLNGIIAMNNIFSSLSLDENGYQIKYERGREENKGGDNELGRNQQNMDDEISDDDSMIKAANTNSHEKKKRKRDGKDKHHSKKKTESGKKKK